MGSCSENHLQCKHILPSRLNFHVPRCSPRLFSILVSTSVRDKCPLKAICDFNTGTQDRLAQAKHPHFFSEIRVVSDKVCANQPANWAVVFYFEDE